MKVKTTVLVRSIIILRKTKILKAVASAALSCALAASSLLGVFAAEGIRMVDRSSVQWAKSVRIYEL